MLGSVTISVKKPSGETYLIRSGNLVVDATRERIANVILNGSVIGQIDEIRLGLVSGGATPAGNDDTTMEAASPLSLPISNQLLENNGLTIKSISETITVSGTAVTFNELGLFQSGAMFSRVVFDTDQSIPIGSQYTVEWKITF